MNSSRSETDCIDEIREKGATMVEFTVVAAAFLFIIIIGAELLRLSYTNLTLQFAASRVLRQAVIGPPTGAPFEYDHAAEIRQNLTQLADGLGVQLQEEHVRICAAPNLNCSVDNAGEGGDLVAIRIARPTTLLFVGEYVARILVVGRNEAF